MLARKALHRVWICAMLLVLGSCFGCAITVQNRYSVFGLDRFLSESAEQARAWSLVLLGSVAFVSAGLGVTGFWLCQRLYRRWRARPETEALPPARERRFSQLGDDRFRPAGRTLEPHAHPGFVLCHACVIPLVRRRQRLGGHHLHRFTVAGEATGALLGANELGAAGDLHRPSK